jgi:hypothetical protein
MPKYTFIVLSNPVEGREDEYNDWYSNAHLDDVFRVPGIVAAQRFILTDAQRMEPPYPWRYLAIYDIETDDLQGVINTFGERSGTPALPTSDAIELPATSLVMEAITPRMLATN